MQREKEMKEKNPWETFSFNARRRNDFNRRINKEWRV
jgi:hypothetical protein